MTIPSSHFRAHARAYQNAAYLADKHAAEAGEIGSLVLRAFAERLRDIAGLYQKAAEEPKS